MKYLKKYFLLTLCISYNFWIQPSLSAQNLIKGKIIDQDNQQVLENASILVENTAQGTVSNAQGFFEIEINTNAKTLLVSHIGYLSQKITLKPNQAFLQIGLKPNPLALHEVIINAFQSEKSLLKTPGAITLLTKQDITRDNELQLAPVLNRVAGVFMQSGTLTTNRITIRGIGARSLFQTAKIRAYWNEIPLTSGEGTTDLEDIDLSLLGRIELIKGPAASMYGAGLGGTILLHSARAEYKQTEFSQQAMIGSFGLQRFVSSFKTGSDKSNFHLNYNHTFSEGWRENNQTERKSLNALGDIATGENQHLHFLVAWINLKAFIPSAIDSLTLAQNPRAAAANWAAAQGFEDYDKLMLGLAYSYEIKPNWELKASSFTSFRSSYEPRPFNILRESDQRVGFRGHLSHSTEGQKWRLENTLGAEYFKEWYNWQTYRISNRVRGAILSDNQETRDYYNFFAQSKLSVGSKWQIDAGINLNRTDYVVNDFFLEDGEDISGNYTFNNVLSPRLAINYLLQKNKSVFVSVGHGFSPPSVAETLTPNGQINPNIRPERGWNYELGSRGTLLKDRLQYDAVLYWMFVSDLLVARRTAEDAFVGINAGKTWHRGLELSLNYALSKANQAIDLQGFATYSLNDYTFQDFIEGDNDFSGNVLTGVPTQVFNAGIDAHSKWGFYGNLNFQFVDEMPIRDDNTLFTEAYQLWNLKLGFQRNFKNGLGFDLNAGIQNLFDVAYVSQVLVNATAPSGVLPRYYYPGLPRNYFLGLKLSYNLQH